MTLAELRNEYGLDHVFENQFDLGKFVHEHGIRNKIKWVELRFPKEKVEKDQDIYYDVAEYTLSKGMAFVNDGFCIIEDFADLNEQ